MKLPCAVVRDLLPLYAEQMTEDETKKLVDEHLEECPECRQRLAETDTGTAAPVDSSKTLFALKKEIRKRRRFSAIIAAMLVFVAVFAFFYHYGKVEPVPWQYGLIKVEGREARSALEAFEGEVPFQSSESGNDYLVVQFDGMISQMEVSEFTDDDGKVTKILQGWRSQNRKNQLTKSYNEMIIHPVPDRVIYTTGSQQQLLWGDPMNGGVAVLPRLALAYYLFAAAGLALAAGIVWFFLRKRKESRIARQVFFAPVSWLLAHFLLKGTGTESFFMVKDFVSILLVAAALYTLFTFAWQIWAQRERSV